MKKRRCRIISIFIIICIFLVEAGPCFTKFATAEKADKWPKGPKNISAASAIVMELNSGVILYEKNMHDKQYPASITKIMTTLLCLENSSLSEVVTFSKEAVFGIERDSSHISIDVGEKMVMEDCLYGIMLMSANEACLGVAEHISGDVKSFVKLMNNKAKALGCQNTHFANPNGLFDENHYTSAYDMALISKEAMKNSVFRKITGTKRYDIPKTNKNKIRNLFNKQEMLYPRNYPQYGYDYCIGGKTGYTNLARWTLVTFAKKGDMELLCVVMRTEGPPTIEPNEYTDTIKLLNFGFENYTKYDVSKNTGLMMDDKPFFTNYNPLFDRSESPLYLEDNTGVVLPNNVDFEKAEQTIEYYGDIEWVEGENTIGRVSYAYGGKEVGSSNIIYNTTQQTRLVGSEPVSDLMDQMTEEESKDQEKQRKKEEDAKRIKERWKLYLVCAAGILTITILVILLAIRIRNDKRRNRFRFFHKRERRKKKKGLHF